MTILSGGPPSTPSEHIYLDMDGVLCDFLKALLALHDRMDLLDAPTYNVETNLGLTSEETWDPVIAAGWEFWDAIEPYPWTFELWAWAREVGDEVAILTHPLILDRPDGRDVGPTVRGKMSWLRRHFGRKFREVIFTPKKHAVSQPGVILVDDNEQYESAFNRRGGRQIVFPQPYNRFHGDRYEPMDSVRTQYQLLRNS